MLSIYCMRDGINQKRHDVTATSMSNSTVQAKKTPLSYGTGSALQSTRMDTIEPVVVGSDKFTSHDIRTRSFGFPCKLQPRHGDKKDRPADGPMDG